jgi:putative nucleotidyltransferase with HDIG domain
MAPRGIGTRDTPVAARIPRLRPRTLAHAPAPARAPRLHPGQLASHRWLMAGWAAVVGIGLALELAVEDRWGSFAGAIVVLAVLLLAAAIGYAALTRRESSVMAGAVLDSLRAARKSALEIARATLSASDRDTADHSDEVAQLCGALCDEFAIEGEDRETVLLAARLHDVGKVAVPPEILNKPGPLDASEWEVIRQHTVVGERILRSVPELGDAAPIVRHSHERWDGNGYPDGLAREEIPLGSRVVLCADAFHAIRSDRPYRRGRSPIEAMEELHANAGTQFDPRVVKAMEALSSRLRRRAVAGIPLSKRTIALLLGGVMALVGTAFATGILPIPKPIAQQLSAPHSRPADSRTAGDPAGAGKERAGAARHPARKASRSARRHQGHRTRGSAAGTSASPSGPSGGSASPGASKGGGPDFPTPVRAHGNPTQANGVARGRPATVVPRGNGR